MRPQVVYLRSAGRRPVRLWDSMERPDLQQEYPAGWCPGCGREIYEWGQETCPECKGVTDEETE